MLTRPMLLGHRGARGEIAENTLASFEHAFALGVDGVELDVGMSADGVLMVYHDRTLNPAVVRDASGHWLDTEGAPLYRLNSEALSDFDVGRINPGSAYARDFPAQRSVDGARIPTLSSVLELVRECAGNELQLIIEVKTSPMAAHETASPQRIADALVELLGRYALDASSVVESFDWRVMSHLHACGTDIRTAFLSAQQSWFDSIGSLSSGSEWTAGWRLDTPDATVPDLVAAAGGRIWAPYHGDLSEANVRRARALQQRIVTWTVNDADDMRKLIELGVDGIITDYPTRLRNVYTELGLILPASRTRADRQQRSSSRRT